MAATDPVWDIIRSSQWRRHLQAQQQPIGLQAAAPAALPPALTARVCCCAPGGDCCCGTAEQCCDGQGFCQVSQHSALCLGKIAGPRRTAAAGWRSGKVSWQGASTQQEQCPHLQHM